MKKKMLMKVIALTLMASLVAVAVCGCASAEAVDVESAEAVEEEEAAEKDAEETVKAYAEWTVKDIAALEGIVSGITNRQYAAGEGANHVIYGDISYDGGIISAVQLNTASVRFDAIGEYGMNYWVYFNLPALVGWMAENGVDTALDGLNAAADVLCVTVGATLLVTEGNPWTKDSAKEEEESNDAVTAAAAASAGSSSGTTSSSSSSKSGGSSSSSSSSKSTGVSSAVCDHDWVENGHYENTDVMIRGSYTYLKCKVCGWKTEGSDVAEDIDEDMTMHIYNAHDGKSSWTVNSVPAEYEQVWVTDKYICSKCGARYELVDGRIHY